MVVSVLLFCKINSFDFVKCLWLVKMLNCNCNKKYSNLIICRLTGPLRHLWICYNLVVEFFCKCRMQNIGLYSSNDRQFQWGTLLCQGIIVTLMLGEWKDLNGKIQCCRQNVILTTNKTHTHAQISLKLNLHE